MQYYLLITIKIYLETANYLLIAFLYCIHIDIDNFIIFLVFCSLTVRCCVLSAINKSITYLLNTWHCSMDNCKL